MDQQPGAKQDPGDLEQRMDAKLDELKAGLKEAIQGFGTRILTAIHGRLGTISIREDSAAKKASQFEGRLMVLERRILKSRNA